MRAVVQLVAKAKVTVAARTVGEIDRGLLVLLGIEKGDTEADGRYLAEKIVNLRIFPDSRGLMNCSVMEIGGKILVVSQFTLLGDCRKGRRPSYSAAAPPETARLLCDSFVQELRSRGVSVATGEFQAMMEVALVNDGPVTLLIDSRKVF